MAYCDRCDRSFQSYHALDQHTANSNNHHMCDYCDLDFETWVGLKEHWVQSRAHSFCQHCNMHFDDEEELAEHMDESHYYCSTCRRVFRNARGLEEHYRQSPAHHYCAPCERHFLSASNLKSHLNSSKHRSKDVPCPFRGCGLSFVSPAALVLHLEAGTCCSGVDRTAVNRYVRQIDKNNTITDPSRLLTNGDSVTTYSASDAAWNGYAYECYLCHNTFRALAGLNQHLASPRHQDKIYICPLNTCRLRLSTLSALLQHIESERCGVYKFERVQRSIQSIVGGVRSLTM